MNDQVFKTLEFDQIKSELLSYAASGLGRRLIEEMKPAVDPRAVAQMLGETTEMRRIVEAAGSVPLHGLSDVNEHMERVARGAVLDPAALTALADLLRGCRRIKQFMSRFQEIAPRVSAYALSITCCQDLEEEIERSIEGARVSNAASPRLAKVRAQIEIVKGRIKDKLNSFLTASQYRDYLQENIICLKEGRHCLAVKAPYRHRVEGVVLSASGSGQTVFVEPAAVRALADELRMLESQEEDEIYQVLSALTGEVAARFQAIRLNIETMAVYDFVCAKAKYSRAIGGTPAEILPDCRINIARGRHPLLGSAAVPLDFRLGGEARTLLITGPNTGGKTVVLKTVGLFVLMTQSGLHVPADRGTAMGVFAKVLADIGDRQSIAQSLSTFSGHMGNIVQILSAAGRGSLVLIDEIGTGTDPAEGAALAAAILDDLHLSGALTAATTHYGDLKRFSERRAGFVNGCMEFDPGTLQPLYRLTIGRAGRSNGLWIAEKLGMPAATLAKARAFLGALPVREGAGEEPSEAWDASAGDESAGASPPQPPSGGGKPEAAPGTEAPRPFQIGDSVYVGSLKENGILCALADARGEAVVLVRDKRIRVNQKRLKLLIPKEQLYPDHEHYDLRIVLLSKEDRRLDLEMGRHHVEGKERIIEDRR